MKKKLTTKFFAALMAAMLMCTFAGCSGKTGEVTIPETSGCDIGSVDPFDYVELGDYESIEIIYEPISIYVGGVDIDTPYIDENTGTYLTLKYCYSPVDPGFETDDWVYPEDEDIARLGIPGVTCWTELKNYIVGKYNENNDITVFMRMGDEFMEQIVAKSTFKELPGEVIAACDRTYADYLAKMLSRYNEIGDIPQMPGSENDACKVLAAMAIAKETGMDTFDYEEVLKYLIEQASSVRY